MDQVISSTFNSVSSGVLYPIYYGIIGIAGVAALIVLIISILGAAFGGENPSASKWRKRAAWVLVGLLIAALAPLLVNGVIALIAGGAAITPVGA